MRKKNRSFTDGVVLFACVLLGVIIFMLLIRWLVPGAIPFGIFEFWKIKAPIWTAVKSSWPLFAWAGGVTCFFSLITKNDRATNRDAEELLFGGFLISAYAGIVEELVFRWLLFLNCIWIVKVSNWLIFGWAGFGVAESFYIYITAPIASFFTLGIIDSILYHPIGWSVGAAVLIANARFRDGHKYLGPFGFINSWFIGIYFFSILFQYGLIACMIVHFLYDLLIFSINYIDSVIERAGGN